MTISHKQHKALVRHKAIMKRRNIKQRNLPKLGNAGAAAALFSKMNTYRLWEL